MIAWPYEAVKVSVKACKAISAADFASFCENVWAKVCVNSCAKARAKALETVGT